MDFELLVIPGCPNTDTARALFEQALALEALDAATVHLKEITTDDQARILAFHGSPTFAADGRDLFPTAGEPAISCRVYQYEQKPVGLPTIFELRTAIRTAATRTATRPDGPAGPSCCP